MSASLIVLIIALAIFVSASVTYLVYMSRHALDDLESYDDSPIELQ